jgi:hypothetical protein
MSSLVMAPVASPHVKTRYSIAAAGGPMSRLLLDVRGQVDDISRSAVLEERIEQRCGDFVDRAVGINRNEETWARDFFRAGTYVFTGGAAVSVLAALVRSAR